MRYAVALKRRFRGVEPRQQTVGDARTDGFAFVRLGAVVLDGIRWAVEPGVVRLFTLSLLPFKAGRSSPRRGQ
jgi:hypothetical protein